MVSKEYRIMYNKYTGDGWELYKQSINLIEIIKSLGVMQVCYPKWRVKIEARTISDWEAMKIE